ncbi:MAG: hypothetical protein U0903_05335 [Planctomycetales bacterium]
MKKTLSLTAGEKIPADAEAWQRVTGAEEALPTEYPWHAGIYSAGEKTWVVNRSSDEDLAGVLEKGKPEGLFSGLNFTPWMMPPETCRRRSRKSGGSSWG